MSRVIRGLKLTSFAMMIICKMSENIQQIVANLNFSSLFVQLEVCFQFEMKRYEGISINCCDLFSFFLYIRIFADYFLVD